MKKFADDGMRLTDCCGSHSTFHDNDLVCKSCWEIVSTGEGDGSEYVVKPVKYVNTKHQSQLADEMRGFLADVQTATWQEIMAFVSINWEVKNWMGPRGALQSLLDRGMIARANDIHNEIYRTCEEES